MKNFLAEIWFQCIINGTKSLHDCPENKKGKPLRSVVVELLKERGYENLATE